MECKWFPTTAEVMEMAKRVTDEGSAEDRLNNPYVPDPWCAHTTPGWKRTKDNDGDDVMSRCDCWKAWKGIQPSSVDRKTVAAGA